MSEQELLALILVQQRELERMSRENERLSRERRHAYEWSRYNFYFLRSEDGILYPENQMYVLCGYGSLQWTTFSTDIFTRRVCKPKLIEVAKSAIIWYGGNRISIDGTGFPEIIFSWDEFYQIGIALEHGEELFDTFVEEMNYFLEHASMSDELCQKNIAHLAEFHSLVREQLERAQRKHQ